LTIGFLFTERGDAMESEETSKRTAGKKIVILIIIFIATAGICAIIGACIADSSPGADATTQFWDMVLGGIYGFL